MTNNNYNHKKISFNMMNIIVIFLYFFKGNKRVVYIFLYYIISLFCMFYVLFRNIFLKLAKLDDKMLFRRIQAVQYDQ